MEVYVPVEGKEKDRKIEQGNKTKVG